MSTAPKICDISVIIPSLNEETEISAAVRQAAGRPGIEVLVVDGGSSDRTVALAEAAGATVLQATAGRGHQLNAGARAARGRILLFLHADTRLPEAFPGLIEQALRQPDLAAGAFRFAVAAPGWRFRLLERLVNWRARAFSLPYGDQALFLSAERFQAVGGFAEIPLLEDLALVRRLRGLGRITLLSAPARTSPRRWLRLGLLRVTLRNQLILLGYLLGVDPGRLARWYGKHR